ncbi:MAG: tetratricopeptide repeat protein [Burkholderiales bacterium]|nr:tetratricopeptide repeat protein [Burkholderiales bacterium]
MRENVTAAEALDPHTGEPRWHLGRLLRALERFTEAAEAQEGALQRESGLVAAHYERAVLAAQRLGERRVELREEWRRRLGERHRRMRSDPADAVGPALQTEAPSDQELARTDPASQRLWGVLHTELSVLEQATGAGTANAANDRPGALSPAMLSCLRGLNALYSPDVGLRREAQDRLEEAVTLDPGLEEAHLVLADLALAAEDAEQASRVLDRALAVDRGHVGLHLRRSQAAHLVALAAERRGEDPRPALRDGIAACERALELRPDDAELLRQRATVHRDAGAWDQSFGSDPAEHYERALTDLDRAVALGCDADLAALDRAHLRLNWGVWLAAAGKTAEAPVSQWQTGIAGLESVLKDRPDRPDAWRLRAALLLHLAKVKLRSGDHPAVELTAAAGDLDQAIALDAEDALAWMTRADVSLTRGLDQARRGVDPTAEYDRARADLERVVRLEPSASEPQNRLADLELNRAVFQDRTGGDARAVLAAALEYAELACARTPGHVASLSLRGRIHMTLAKMRLRHGENPEASIRAALADLDAADQRSPGNLDVACDRADVLGVRAQTANAAGVEAAFAEAVAAADRAVLSASREARTWRKRGELRELWGGHRVDRGHSPETILAEAERDLRTALELDGTAPATWFTLGRVQMHLGRDAARRGGDPEPAWTAAEQAFGKASAGMPTLAREQCGLLCSFRAEARIGRSEDPDAPLRQAVAEYSEVLRLNPDSRTAWRLRGEAHHLRAVWQMQSGQDPGASAELALADLAEALKRTPGAVAVLRNRALLRTNLGAWKLSHQGDAGVEFAAAAEDHAAVAEQVPQDASVHKSLAVVLTQVGFLRLDRGLDAGEVLRRARAEFDAALSLGGPDWECHWRRGIASLVLSEWDAAVTDLEAAEQLAPERAGLWARPLEESRARRAAAAGPSRED